MEYRIMGKTGLQLSVLSYGSWVTFAKQIDDGISVYRRELRFRGQGCS